LPTSSVTVPDPPKELLERSHHLSVLSEALEVVRSSAGGRLVLVGGEAGGGKTALLRRFCDEHRSSARVLEGACDALFAPRPLGPLLDVTQATGGELEELVERGASPYEIAAALMRELAVRVPTIFVLEDVHWADEATLDVLTLLARRIETVPALVVASYRDDELDHAHPLRLVLGQLASTAAVSRLKIEPFSPEAVRRLAAPHGLDADELYGKTAGNPFFVMEVLAGANEEIPSTIRDAVLARAARLSPSAAALLEAVAVAPAEVELWLLEALAGDVIDCLDECVTSGMLAHGREGVAFRHELARLAVEGSLPAHRRRSLHRRALAALADPPSGPPDLERLAHHADAAGDADAVLRFAPVAASRAGSLGAHREAAAQYARALRFADGLPPAERAELLERHAYECFLIGQLEDALEAQEQAVELRHQIGDLLEEGDSLRSLSRLLRFIGRTAEATVVGRESVALLARFPQSHKLAMAYHNLGHIYLTADDTQGGILWGTRALELAEQLDDIEARAYAVGIIGASEVLAGKPDGLDKIELSIELARHVGNDDQVGWEFVNLVMWPLRQRWYAAARRHLTAGLEYCAERGLDLWLVALLACRSRLELDEGHWAEAGETAAWVVRDPRTWPGPRVLALSVLGLVRARRGDHDVWEPLDEALSLAEPTGELQRIGPTATARAEAAWLEGRHDAVAKATEAALELAVERRASWMIGELAYWRFRAGIHEEIPPGAAEPYAAQIAGNWARAAELWTELGCPYEAALALADGGEEEPLRRALEELQRLGARPAAATVARRLRERGARGLPRGPRAATRKNPAGLTARELEVLALVAEGLRNAEIAERLYLAEKTVDHYVSAILRKLDARTRTQASAEAVRLGLTGQAQ